MTEKEREVLFRGLLDRQRDMIWHVCESYSLSAAWETEDAFQEVLCVLWNQGFRHLYRKLMKHTVPSILALVLLLAGCSHPKDEVTSAAMDIYKQYCHHSKTLGVAFVGDYQADGQTYNAVMFRTSDSTEWEWLKKEFGVLTAEEIQDVANNSSVITTPGNGAETPEQPEGSMMGAIMVDPDREFKDTAEFMAYIDSMVFEMLREAYGDSVAKARMHSVMVMDLDSMPDKAPAGKIYNHQQMATFTTKHGNVAYFVNADHENHTIWLFFKDTTPEDNSR